MGNKDCMKLEIPGYSSNESFARAVVAAFAARKDPTLEEISDIKTAVSEAVTNAIIHAYDHKESPGSVIILAWTEKESLIVEVVDQGVGISDLEKAREAFYTSKPELERSGMGFTIMESFMDEVEIETTLEEGTTVRMVKYLSSKKLQGEKSYGSAE